MSKCPFCDFIDNTNCKIKLQNDLCIFVHCPNDIPEGGGMIIPKAHRATVFDLTPEEWEATYSMLHEAKALIDAQYKPDGYSVGWNVGKVGGQEVFHAHLHIIPRYKDELYAGKGIRYWIKQPENKRNREKE